MEKKHPSDELVNTLFNFFVKGGYPRYYDFPEYMNFIDSAVNFKDMPEDYSIYDKCRLFSGISKKQREYILTKNKEHIKALIKEHTIDEDIFNLNYFNYNLLFNEFFLNKKISIEEKKELVNLHSINTLTPLDETMKSIKGLSKEEIFNWLDLTPTNRIYVYADKWKNNKYLTSILKEYNEEIYNLAKSCENYIDFLGLLYINHDYVAAHFNNKDGRFEILTGGITFYNKLRNSEFWYEYNIPGEKRDFYNKVENLYYGTLKERTFYNEIKGHKLNTWHDLESVSSQIEEDLQKAYPKEKILEILKKISENKEVLEEEKKMYSEFYKGINYIYNNHNAQTFIRPQEPYFWAIADTNEFKAFSSFPSYEFICRYLQQANNKIKQKGIEER